MRPERSDRYTHDARRDPVAHASALLRGSRHPRTYPALGSPACAEGLLRHGRTPGRVPLGPDDIEPGALPCWRSSRRLRGTAPTIGCSGWIGNGSVLEDDIAFIVANFFHAQRQRLIDPFPRYAELLSLRGSTATPADLRAAARRFTTDDLRDLQVWQKLAWLDPFSFDRDPRARALVAKGAPSRRTTRRRSEASSSSC